MDALVLLVVLGLALGAALAAARGLLGALLHMMAHGGPAVTLQWRPVVFVAALFWFWYLTPAFASQAAVERVLELLSR